MEGGEKEKKKGKREGKQTREKKKKSDREREKGERNKGGRFSLHSDGRSSMVREEKSIHATRATREYQNLRVLSKFVR